MRDLDTCSNESNATYASVRFNYQNCVAYHSICVFRLHFSIFFQKQNKQEIECGFGKRTIYLRILEIGHRFPSAILSTSCVTKCVYLIWARRVCWIHKFTYRENILAENEKGRHASEPKIVCTLIWLTCCQAPYISFLCTFISFLVFHCIFFLVRRNQIINI